MKISLVRAKDPSVDPSILVLGWTAARSASSFSHYSRLIDSIDPKHVGDGLRNDVQSRLAAVAGSCLFADFPLDHR